VRHLRLPNLLAFRPAVVHFRKEDVGIMLKQKIKRILQKNHFWRTVGFDELSELYVSNLLRIVALGIFLVFVPYYLYHEGYSVAAIFTLFGVFMAIRVMADFAAGYYVARFGPKHAMVISCILQIVSVILLLSVPMFHWSVVLLALPWGISNSFFFIAYHVMFSKIKHTPRAGAELGHMMTYEKIGGLLGPIIGGLLGSAFGPQYIFLIATALFFGSLWPLFLTKEPVLTRQKLDFKSLPLHKIKDDLVSYCFMGVENTLCVNIWPFYVAVFVLSGAVYAQLGALSALGVLSAILAAKAIGRLVDSEVARPVLRLSALINAGMYTVRPLVTNLGGVLAVNVVNEAVTTGYRMPFIKGIYAAADDLPGHRIAYITVMEAFSSVAKATAWFILAMLATIVSLKTVLLIGFAMAGLASLGILKERFAVYNR
jgi:MFS family permease